MKMIVIRMRRKIRRLGSNFDLRMVNTAKYSLINSALNDRFTIRERSKQIIYDFLDHMKKTEMFRAKSEDYYKGVLQT